MVSFLLPTWVDQFADSLRQPRAQEFFIGEEEEEARSFTVLGTWSLHDPFNMTQKQWVITPLFKGLPNFRLLFDLCVWFCPFLVGRAMPSFSC